MEKATLHPAVIKMLDELTTEACGIIRQYGGIPERKASIEYIGNLIGTIRSFGFEGVDKPSEEAISQAIVKLAGSDKPKSFQALLEEVNNES